MVDPLLVYQIVEDVGGVAYELYSNWGSDISIKLLRKKVKSSDRIARIAVVGLGGSGKTTLIKTLTACDGIDPKISTLGVCPIILGKEEKTGSLFGRTRRTTIIYCDTDGQSPNTFLKKMLSADNDDILHSGCFDAIIFVLDLKDSGIAVHRDEDVITSIDWDRVDEHNTEWGHYSLSFLFDALSDKLKLCIVFINKCNLIREMVGRKRPALETDILDRLTPMIRRLQDRTKGVSFKIVFGSARDAQEVYQLRREIEEKVLKDAETGA
jgi:hypothetical protein